MSDQDDDPFDTIMEWAFGIGIGLVVVCLFVRMAYDILAGN